MYLVQNVNGAEVGLKALLGGETQEQTMPSNEKREERGEVSRSGVRTIPELRLGGARGLVDPSSRIP